MKISGSYSHNLKSASENRKWAGLSVIVFVFALCGAAATAQQPEKIYRIGFLAPTTASGMAVLVDAFREELRELGWDRRKEYRDRVPVCGAQV